MCAYIIMYKSMYYRTTEALNRHFFKTKTENHSTIYYEKKDKNFQ